MVLTKAELLEALTHEVHLLLHLASKADPSMLDYRPTPKQRSTIEVLRYLSMVGPLNMRATLAPTFDMQTFGNMFNEAEASVKLMSFERVKEEIGKLPALYAGLLDSCPDAYLREKIAMFGTPLSRGAWLVNLVLCHHAAYRMQLFLYLKASGREELNTMNLWAGTDAPMPA
jgi:hypothetical protein